MKLSNIKVNSYGNMQNKEIDFIDGINIIQGKNESGKSTLLSYIINMFYGISKNKEGKSFSDYDKYKPWNSTEFSGKLTYLLDSGKKYEIFRDFSKKNPKIYNEKYEDISDEYNINKKEGNQFFTMQTNVDKQTYISTVVSMQQDVRLDEKNQNMLVQKIANLAGSGEDNVSYKKAVIKLQEKIRDEIGTNKTSQKPINMAENELSNVELELEKIKIYETKKYDIDNEKENINSNIEKLENKKHLAQEIRNIYEDKSSALQKLEINSNSQKDNMANLEQLYYKEKQYETNKENIKKDLAVLEELKENKIKEIEELNKKSEELNLQSEAKEKKLKAGIKKYLIAESILILFMFFNILYLKNSIATIGIIISILVVLGICFLENIKLNNKSRQKQERKQQEMLETIKSNTMKKEELERELLDIEKNINNITEKQNENNNQLSMIKGQISLLEENCNNIQKEINNINKDVKDSFENRKKQLGELFEYKLDKNDIEKIINNIDIKLELANIETELNNNKLKLRALELEEKNIIPQLDNIVVLKEKQLILQERIVELKKQEKIINLALKNLANAYEVMKTTITPKFTQNLSNNVSKISNGKYTKVAINDEKGMVVENLKGEYIEADKLSVGTIDQLYLSLRLAMIDDLSEETLPIMLDETFAYFDNERIENVLEYMINELNNHQIILFTCSNREIEILNKLNIEYNLITL